MRLEADKIYNDYFNDDKYPKIGVSAIVYGHPKCNSEEYERKIVASKEVDYNSVEQRNWLGIE